MAQSADEVKQIRDHIAGTLRFYHSPGDCFEIRAIGSVNGRKIVAAGFFDDQEKAVAAVLGLVSANRHEGIYVTINPVDPALLGRANNRMAHNISGTADQNVKVLRRLLVDIDPERPSGVSSSNHEHDFAIEHARHIKDVLCKEGWPEPLLGDSGNGAHLIYRLPDLENSPDNVDLLKRVLRGLNQRFMVHRDGVTLKVDEKVFNPSRISKIYGTLAKKGQHLNDRPHRWARILSGADSEGVVTLAQLTSITAVDEQKPAARPPHSNENNARLDVPAYLEKYGVEMTGTKQHGSSTLYLLRECIFDSSHRGKDAAIGQTAEGKLFYQCFHDSCRGRTWHDARSKISGSDPLFERRHKLSTSNSMSSNEEGRQLTDWSRAIELFPPVMFPWDAFPEKVAASFQQLARACASSAFSLPGAAFCLLASALGRAVSVSPKEGWSEPFIFWHADIRPSGAGKTPAARELAQVFHQAQAREEARWKAEKDEWQKLPPKERHQHDPPTRARGYFATDLTLEGLRDDLTDHPTGGTVIIQDELSGFITAQNQYKAKGNDRESWLMLWDGKPARVVRKDRSVFLSGARVSVFGGIQPGVFQRVFSKDEEGIFLVDGTIFRFLLTCEGHSFHELTAEAWQDANRAVWNHIIESAQHWADEQVTRDPPTLRQLLNIEAQQFFLDWRNEREGLIHDLPEQFRGFLPKAYSYALRLAGVIHCLHRFHEGDEPDSILTLIDIQRGIRAVEFYLGQTVGALQVLEDSTHQPDAQDERALHLARVLDSLRGEVDSGRLAVGYVHERFNIGIPDQQRFKSAKATGAFMRSVGLTMSPGKHDANGKRAAFCLLWDKETISFLETRLQSLQSLQTIDGQGSANADIENAKSAMSANHAPRDGSMQTLQTLKKQSLQPGTMTGEQSADDADIADFVSSKEKISTSTSGVTEVEEFI
jgi:hypothetical protein